jgi:hypothetical protein
MLLATLGTTERDTMSPTLTTRKITPDRFIL